MLFSFCQLLGAFLINLNGLTVYLKAGGRINHKAYFLDKHETKAHHKTHNKLTLLISSNIIKNTKGFAFAL